MTKYTMGTGGGSGDDANYCIWKDRDSTAVSSYSDQLSKLYLTPIYMMDKAAGFKMVKTKGPIPPNAAIQDGGTPDTTTSTPVRADRNTSLILERLTTLSEKRALDSKEMFAAMTGGQESSTAEQIELIVDNIAKTRAQIDVCDVDLAKYWDEKQTIKTGVGKSDEKKKKARVIKEKMTETKSLKSALEGALAVQRKELENLNPTKKTSEDRVESDSFSSGYESS